MSKEADIAHIKDQKNIDPEKTLTRRGFLRGVFAVAAVTTARGRGSVLRWG